QKEATGLMFVVDSEVRATTSECAAAVLPKNPLTDLA
ncbi:hypothetical protein Tco_0560141, partial [Tanacetum coccineum]